MFCVNCKANKLKKSGGAGYVERSKASFKGKLLQPEPDDGSPGSLYRVEGREFNLQEGMLCTVTLDSGTYTAECKSFQGLAFYIGNPVFLGAGEDNGESYIVCEAQDEPGVWVSFVADTNFGNAFTVTTETETIHPIDPKFLPEGGVGYTEKKSNGYLLSPVTYTTEEVDGVCGGTIEDTSVIDISMCGTLEDDKNQYEVTFDGVKYPLYSLKLVTLGEDPFVGFGNEALLNPEATDTGEPFMFYIDVLGAICIVATKEPGEHTASIEAIAETIHPIEPKFLPGVCLPVVEIASAVYDPNSKALLTEEESAAMDTACASSTHIIVNVPLYEGVPGYPVICRVLKEEEDVILMGMLGAYEFIADNNAGGLWEIGG